MTWRKTIWNKVERPRSPASRTCVPDEQRDLRDHVVGDCNRAPGRMSAKATAPLISATTSVSTSAD